MDKLEPLAVSAAEKPVLYVKPIAVRPNIAAQMLDISRPKVYELAARDDFHGVFKFGGCTLFSVEGLEEWVRKQCAAGGTNGQ